MALFRELPTCSESKELAASRSASWGIVYVRMASVDLDDHTNVSFLMIERDA